VTQSNGCRNRRRERYVAGAVRIGLPEELRCAVTADVSRLLANEGWKLLTAGLSIREREGPGPQTSACPS
jgi:hypothetical protein